MEGIGAAETCCMLEGKGIGRLVSNPANSFASMLVEFCCKKRSIFKKSFTIYNTSNLQLFCQHASGILLQNKTVFFKFFF
jgi:hypothetical protein